MTLFGTEARLRLTDGTFSWFEGRATEERPSWGYAKAMSDRMGRATAAIDLQTGGGEVLAQVEKFPALIAATESWPPNVAIATRLLGARGVVVVIDEDEPPLPFGDEAFDLVVSRHPIKGMSQDRSSTAVHAFPPFSSDKLLTISHMASSFLQCTGKISLESSTWRYLLFATRWSSQCL